MRFGISNINNEIKSTGINKHNMGDSKVKLRHQNTDGKPQTEV